MTSVKSSPTTCAFGHYLEGVRGSGVALENLRFVEADMAAVTIPDDGVVICIHACNEATKVALETAVAAGACYAAMPCCIPDGIYLRRIKHTDHQTRYVATVGVIGGQYGAHKITAIDERITNRNLILLGDAQSRRTSGPPGQRVPHVEVRKYPADLLRAVGLRPIRTEDGHVDAGGCKGTARPHPG